MGDFCRQPTRMYAHRGAVGPVLPGSQCLAKLGSLSFRRFVRRFHHILHVLKGKCHADAVRQLAHAGALYSWQHSVGRRFGRRRILFDQIRNK